MVLEQSDKLRPQGTSITLWNNGMRILELFDLARPIQEHVSQRSKVLVGYDGVNLIIGFWLDLEQPKSVGRLRYEEW
ncbi:unnamed protein product [Sphagnum jensenii]|uniref:Uncharacterized protein n=2 Tax=Sphagnum jensenii TaxID=128206 RepID=A0ABP1AD63_9BRYO